MYLNNNTTKCPVYKAEGQHLQKVQFILLWKARTEGPKFGPKQGIIAR